MDEKVPRTRVLVCGGRYFDNYAFLKATLSLLPPDPDRIFCHGGATGADSLVTLFCLEEGSPCEIIRADWEKHGKAAGPIRNQQMLDEFKPDVVIAFPGGRGTQNMISLARKAGVEVIDIGASAHDN